MKKRTSVIIITVISLLSNLLLPLTILSANVETDLKIEEISNDYVEMDKSKAHNKEHEYFSNNEVFENEQIQEEKDILESTATPENDATDEETQEATLEVNDENQNADEDIKTEKHEEVIDLKIEQIEAQNEVEPDEIETTSKNIDSTTETSIVKDVFSLEKTRDLAMQMMKENLARKNSNISLFSGISHVDSFIENFSPLAVQYAHTYGLYPSVMLAQAALESGWGRSKLSVPPYHQLFGIKNSQSFTGNTIIVDTQEWVKDESHPDGGYYIVVPAEFRVYDSYEGSFKDQGMFLQAPRYNNVLVKNAPTYKHATQALQLAGYATDPEYANKLNSIIDSYNFEKFDSLISISYSTHIKGSGWQTSVKDGKVSGITNADKMITGVRLDISNPNLDVEYTTHVQTYGWLDWVNSNKISGAPNLGRRVEALKLRLTGLDANKYDIYYRVHVHGIGPLDWAKNGEPAGTEGYALSAEAIEVEILPKGTYETDTSKSFKAFTKPIVSYQTHVQTHGWLNYVEHGQTSGTINQNKRLEAIRMNLQQQPFDGSIVYRSFISGRGWTGWAAEGYTAGTINQATPLEAVAMKLTGKMSEEYDIYYRAYVPTLGWLGWAKNGESAGTEGYVVNPEAIEVEILPKGTYETDTSESFKVFTEPTVSYQTHVQTHGWLNYVKNGQTSGTINQNKRLEAVRMNLQQQPYDGSIVYRSFISGRGWTGWAAEGYTAGTINQATPLEAVAMKLTGKMSEEYDIYYRAYVPTLGWLGWAKNGMSAGTNNSNFKIEAIEVNLIEKGSGPKVDETEAYLEKKIIYLDPGHGSSDTGASYDGTHERELNLNISLKVRNELEKLGYTVIMSREKRNNSYSSNSRTDLFSRPAHANKVGADLYVSIHHNALPSSTIVRGIETFIYGVNSAYPPLPENSGSHNDPARLAQSKKIADSIHKELIYNTGAMDRGVKKGSYVVVREAKMPAVLLELGFMSNPVELNLLKTQSYQQKLISGIVKGIHNYFRKQ